MLSKRQLQLITSLHHKKFRTIEKLFIAEGVKIVQDLLTSGWEVHSLYISRDAADEMNFGDVSFPVYTISERELEKISALTTSQDVLAVVRMPGRTIELDSLKGKLTLLLDEIRDPGNLGTIIRIADWFGIDSVFYSENSADLFNPKVVQAAMGSVFRVPVFYSDMKELLKYNYEKLKLPVYGTLLDGENIFDARLSKEGLILIGNESRGIREELFPYITQKLTIPSFSNSTNGKPDSLNAAVAAGLVCSEFRKRS